jgi:hypothetical protein
MSHLGHFDDEAGTHQFVYGDLFQFKFCEAKVASSISRTAMIEDVESLSQLMMHCSHYNKIRLCEFAVINTDKKLYNFNEAEETKV